MFNDKLCELRCDLYREVKNSIQKEVLKGARWLLLKNVPNLNEDKNGKTKAEEDIPHKKSGNEWFKIFRSGV